MSQKRQVKKILPFRVGPKWSDSAKTPPSSSGIPKYYPDQLKHPPDTQKQKRHKQTPTDTVRCLQTLQDNSQTLLKTGANPPFWQNRERQDFFT